MATTSSSTEPPAPLLPSFVVVDSSGAEIPVPTPTKSQTGVELRATGASAKALWSVSCKSIQSYRADGKGGVVVVGERKGELAVFGVDDTGNVAWSLPTRAVRSTVGGPISDDGTMAVALIRTDVDIWRISQGGRKLGTLRLKSSYSHQVRLSASGVVITAADDGTAQFFRADGTPIWSGSTIAPTGDVSHWTGHRPNIHAHADGSLWLLTADRRVVAHGPDGRPAWSLGLRSTPSQTWSLRNGDVLLASAGCALTRLGPNGAARWSTEVSIDGAPRCTWKPTFVAEEASGVLFVRTTPGYGAREIRALSADGALRWKVPLPAQSYPGTFEPAGPDQVVVVDRRKERSTFVRPPGKPAADFGPEVRVGQFTQHLEQGIDSGIALSEQQAYALSGEQLWSWDGSSWTGGRKLRAVLGRARKGDLRLAEFKPQRLVAGAGGQAWLTGWRSTEGPTVMRPDVPTLLRLREGVWREDTTVVRAFFEDTSGHFEAEAGLRVASLSTKAIACGSRFCRSFASGRWARERLEYEHASLGASGGAFWLLHDKGLSSIGGGGSGSHPGLENRSSNVLWSAGEGTLWSVGTYLARFDGSRWTRVASLVGATTGIWGSTADDVWLTGKSGVAHWDGTRWRRVVGLHGQVRGVFGAGKNVWFAAEDGLWRFEGWAGGPTSSRTIEPPPAMPYQEVPLRRLAKCQDGYRIGVKSFPVAAGPELSAATEVAVAADGTTWFRDGARLVELRDGAARTLDHRFAKIGHRRLAPRAPGRGWLLDSAGVVAIDGANRTRETARLPSLQAVGASKGGTLWAVAAGEDDGLPKAFTISGSTVSYRHSIPNAAYVAVSTWGSDEVWMAGGLHATQNAGETWPAGEGIVVHGTKAGFTWTRVPAGPLLSMAGVGPDHAWAVGPAGLVVQIRGHQVRTERIEPSYWLRGVAGTGPNDVWMVGDDGLLVHWDGKAMCRLSPVPLAKRPQLTSVAARAPKKAWVVSPDGILDVQAP